MKNQEHIESRIFTHLGPIEIQFKIWLINKF